MSDSKLAQRVTTLAIIVVVAFGLVVPALILTSNGANKASAAVGVHLNKHEIKGRELFAHTCAICHSLAAVKSYSRVGPDLDYLIGKQIAPAERKAFIETTIKEGLAGGGGQMPALLYQGKEAEDVADFVAAVAGH